MSTSKLPAFLHLDKAMITEKRVIGIGSFGCCKQRAVYIMEMSKVVNGPVCEIFFARVKDMSVFIDQHVTEQFRKGNVQDSTRIQ